MYQDLLESRTTAPCDMQMMMTTRTKSASFLMILPFLSCIRYRCTSNDKSNVTDVSELTLHIIFNRDLFCQARQHFMISPLPSYSIPSATFSRSSVCLMWMVVFYLICNNIDLPFYVMMWWSFSGKEPMCIYSHDVMEPPSRCDM